MYQPCGYLLSEIHFLVANVASLECGFIIIQVTVGKLLSTLKQEGSNLLSNITILLFCLFYNHRCGEGYGVLLLHKTKTCILLLFYSILELKVREKESKLESQELLKNRVLSTFSEIYHCFLHFRTLLRYGRQRLQSGRLRFSTDIGI